MIVVLATFAVFALILAAAVVAYDRLAPGADPLERIWQLGEPADGIGS